MPHTNENEKNLQIEIHNAYHYQHFEHSPEAVDRGCYNRDNKYGEIQFLLEKKMLK